MNRRSAGMVEWIIRCLLRPVECGDGLYIAERSWLFPPTIVRLKRPLRQWSVPFAQSIKNERELKGRFCIEYRRFKSGDGFRPKIPSGISRRLRVDLCVFIARQESHP